MIKTVQGESQPYCKHNELRAKHFDIVLLLIGDIFGLSRTCVSLRDAHFRSASFRKERICRSAAKGTTKVGSQTNGNAPIAIGGGST